MGFAQKGAAPVREVSPFSISASCGGDFLSGAWRDHRRPPSRRHFLPFCREAMDHPGAALFCFFALVLFEKYFTKGIASEFLGNRLLASAHVFAAAVSPLMARAVRQREIFRQTRSGFIRGGVFSILDLHRRFSAVFRGWKLFDKTRNSGSVCFSSGGKASDSSICFGFCVFHRGAKEKS